ncbi:hypothetical protein PM082_008000 [Marasmius tenuissimus]|nr:hypothetical protein PM082_008000 [Marasmius tenuissimus]
MASSLKHYRKIHPGYERGGKPRPLVQYAGYLPEHREVYHAFFDELAQVAAKSEAEDTPYLPAVERFKQSIEGDKLLYDLFQKIFLEVDPQYLYQNQVKNWEDLLRKLNVIVSGPPKYYVAKDDQGNEIAGEPVGVPIYLMLDILINTSSAYDLFRNHNFNIALSGLLDTWGEYLTTSDSSKTLNTTAEGWFNTESVAKLEGKGRGVFTETYTTFDDNPDNGYGYKSWDDFFVRRLKEPVSKTRPINDLEAASIDPTLIVHHACESTVVRISENVQLHDRFWLKAQSYSLYEMLNHDPSAKEFIGGSIYQSFLGPQDYHRWHSPVDGTIEKAEVVYGTYYAALPDEGAPPDDSDLHSGVPFGAYLRSQPWLTVVATRALIWIRAKNPKIGLLCFIGIGMVEVSTCDIGAAQALKGKEVKTGQEIGSFHFGGSGHCLVFRKDAQIKFDFPEAQPGAGPTDSLPKIPGLPPIEKQGLKEDGEGDEQPDPYEYIYGTHLWVNSIIGYSTA